MFGRMAMRLGGLIAALALVFSLVSAGKRFFFCAAMDRLHADVSCCSHFETSLEDQIRAEREGMALTEDERCCEERVQAQLPGATASADPPSFAAPWVGTIDVLRAVDYAPPARPVVVRERAVATGPPVASAIDHCARLSVFLI